MQNLMRKLRTYAIVTLLVLGCGSSVSFGQEPERATVSGWCETVQEAKDLLKLEHKSKDQILFLNSNTNRCIKLDLMYEYGLVSAPFVLGTKLKSLNMEVIGADNHVYGIYSGEFLGTGEKFISWQYIRTLDKL